MDIIRAKTAGFCFGVKRAVDKVYEQIGTHEKIYTFGPIIHNDEVVKDLEAKGVITINDESELAGIKDGIVIIRSHGVSKHIIDLLTKENINYIDMTCPFVKRIHDIVKDASADSNIVIIGNASHPEVEGIKGWSNINASVIETIEEANEYIAPDNKPICVVSQTTFNYNKFKELVEILQKKGYDVNVVDTICDATRKRQIEAKDIASNVDAMIVIGDLKSSNSKKLYDICKGECENTSFIQTLAELDVKRLDGVSRIGITAGASTPNNIIEEVQNYVRINF